MTDASQASDLFTSPADEEPQTLRLAHSALAGVADEIHEVADPGIEIDRGILLGGRRGLRGPTRAAGTHRVERVIVVDRNEMRTLWNDSERIRTGASAGAGAVARQGLDLSRDAAERAMESYETEYEMVADVDPRTGQTRFYLPSTYRSMQAARIRRDNKRALRRELARLGITAVTIR